MGERLIYVDMVRGFACLWMIFTQLFDAFCGDYARWGGDYASIKYVEWVPSFMVVAGFSIKLMFEKYETKPFLKKVLSRFIKFTFVGWFLIFSCQFNVNGLFGEVVSAIGLNLLIAAIVLIGLKKVANWNGGYTFMALSFILLFLNETLKWAESFNPLWCLSFMFFGVTLASTRNDNKKFWLATLVLGFTGLYFLPSVDFASRNIPFWCLNVSFVIFLLIIMLELQKVGLPQKFLAYFGRHSLFFYILHFGIVWKVLMIFNAFDSFNYYTSFVFTVLSMSLLVLLELLRNKTNTPTLRKVKKMIAVKRVLVEELLKDSEWLDRLGKAKSFGEVEKVLRLFVEAKRSKVKEILIK